MAQVVLSNKCKQPFKHALVLSSISKKRDFSQKGRTLCVPINMTATFCFTVNQPTESQIIN